MIGDRVDLAALYQQTKTEVERATPDAGDRAFVLALARATIARSAVLQESRGHRNIGGENPCPCCGGGLRWVVQANGHIWAHCRTDGCVSFLE